MRRHPSRTARGAVGAAVCLAVGLLAGCDSPAPTDVAPLSDDLLSLNAAPAPVAAAHNFSADVPVAWFNLSYELTRDEGLSPPVASRAWGYAGVTLWETVVSGIPTHQSLAGQLNGLGPLPRLRGGVHFPAAANAALAIIMRRLYTDQVSQQRILKLEKEFLTQFQQTVPPGILRNSLQHGHRIASAIHDWSLGDGFAVKNNCAFTPPVGEGLWRPTPPAFAANPLQPCWGQMRTFAIKDGSACDQGPPPTFSTAPGSVFHDAALEVYNTVNNLTAEQSAIALFWADNPGQTGTPPGHWIFILGQVLTDGGRDLAFASEAYAKVGIGVADAFITCWWSKYTYHTLRPITYINDHIDPTWATHIPTPPFPEYTSGHSTQSGSTGTSMTDLFGDNFAFFDDTHAVIDLPGRSFDSFMQAAREAMVSRLYGGIHYTFGNETGFAQGECVGRAVNALKFKKAGGGPVT